MFLSIGWGADETIFSWYQIGTGQLDECIGWLQRFYLVFLESSWLPRVKIFLQWKAMTMFFPWEDISVVIVKIIKIRHQKGHSSKRKKKIWIILMQHHIVVVHAKGEVIFHLHLQSFEIIRVTRISWLFLFWMQS